MEMYFINRDTSILILLKSNCIFICMEMYFINRDTYILIVTFIIRWPTINPLFYVLRSSSKYEMETRTLKYVI